MYIGYHSYIYAYIYIHTHIFYVPCESNQYNKYFMFYSIKTSDNISRLLRKRHLCLSFTFSLYNQKYSYLKLSLEKFLLFFLYFVMEL